MKLSIITINYNNAEGLLKTIESVIDQTSKDFEYIIIDGGSNDGSIAIIKKYQHKITHWVSEPDQGIYHAMNKGIKAAKGEYCQFLNSGDTLVDREVVAKMLQIIPDSGIVIGNMLKKLPNGKIIKDIGVGNNEITMFTLYKGSLNHSPAYIKRSLFEKYGFYDEKLKIVSDWKWYINAIIFEEQKVIYVDIDVSIFCLDGISTLNIPLLKSERAKVLNELLPKSIIADYDRFGQDIPKLNRIKRYKYIRWLFFFVERVLFKIEKFNRTHLSKKKSFY